MSISPDQAHGVIAAAERRAFQRQMLQVRLILIGLLGITVIAGFSAAGFWYTYRQSVSNGQIGQRVLSLTENVATLQGQVLTATAIAQLGTNRILDCTTPEGQCSRDQQGQVGAAIASLNQANAVGRRDSLTKIGRMLGLPKAAIDQVLGSPEPPPPPYVRPTQQAIP